MVLELRRHGVRQHVFRRQSAADQPVRCRCLLRCGVPAPGAAEHGTLDHDPNVVGRDIVQPLRGLGPDRLALAAAGWAGSRLRLQVAGDRGNFLADLPAARRPRGRPRLRGSATRRSSGRRSPVAASTSAAPPPASPPVGSSSQMKAGQSSSTSDSTVSANTPWRSDDELNSIPANRRAVRTAVWNRSSSSSREDLTFFSSRRNCAFSDSSRALPRSARASASCSAAVSPIQCSRCSSSRAFSADARPVKLRHFPAVVFRRPQTGHRPCRSRATASRRRGRRKTRLRGTESPGRPFRLRPVVSPASCQPAAR